MARGITQDQVNSVIERLLLAGERPTIERVRGALGTGSPNTLTRMLDVWWQGLGARLATQRSSAVVPEAPPKVIDAASALWEAALAAAKEVADSALLQERQTLTADLAALADEKQGLASAMTLAQVARQEAEQAQHEAETRLQDLQRLADQQCAQIHDLQGRLTSTEAEASEAAERLQSAEATLTAARDQAAQERRDAETVHRSAENRWLLEVDQLRQERARLARQVQKFETDGKSALKAAQTRLTALTNQITAAEKLEAAAVARASALESQLDRLHDQLTARLAPPKRTSRRPTPPRRKVPKTTP